MLTQAPRARGQRWTAVNGSTAQRGFTLMELMVVVAIMGVLAALATYGVRKYTLSAKKAEATSMLTQIRSAEEAYRDEAFSYLGGADFETWHPVNSPSPDKHSWNVTSPNSMTNTFLTLGVQATGPVLYSYAVVAGTAGDDVPELPDDSTRTYVIPEPTGPFYVAMAKADLDGNGAFTYALAWSGSSEIWVDDIY